MTWLNQRRTPIPRHHARAGTAAHVVRNVLIFSITLALIALAVALVFGKPPAHDNPGSAVTGGPAQ